MIQIPVSTLKAAMLFLPKEDIRYYLMGVHFKVRDNMCRLTASDGHTLFTDVIECEHQDEEFIIPKDNIKLAIDIAKADNSKYVHISNNTCGVEYTPIDSKYPNIAKMLEAKEVEKGHLYFNMEYLARAQKAVSIYMNYKYRNLKMKYMKLDSQENTEIASYKIDNMQIIIMPCGND